MKIVIGESAEGKKVGFDLDTLITTRALIQANSGAGKSYLLRKLMEVLFGHIQIITIDPEGEFATLREKFGFVLVGKGGETPADIRSAATVAEKLLELKASAICDLYEMKSADRHVWVKTFLDAMINAPKKLWHPVVVIVDEAQLFCPQGGKGGSESVAKEAMVDLVTRGRKRGYCAVWATQRLAKVDKDATSSLLNRLVGGTFEDVDIKRALDLLSVSPEDKMEVVHQLRTMEPGYFFAFGRALSKERVLFKSGKVETSHPQPGSAKHAAEPPPPPEKVMALLPKLADLPKEAEEKARTVDDFKRRIRELSAELAQAKKAQPAAAPAKSAIDRHALQQAMQTKAALRKTLEDAMKIIAKVTAIGFEKTELNAEQLKSIFDKAADQIARLADQRIAQRVRELEELKSKAGQLQYRAQKLLEAAADDVTVELNVTQRTPALIEQPHKVSSRAASREETMTGPSSKSASERAPSDFNNGSLSRSQTKILEALATFEAIGRTPVSKKWTAALSEASHTSSTFGNNLGALRSQGLIDYPQPGLVALTEAGRAAAPATDVPTSSEEILERCKTIVSASQWAILQALVKAYPDAVNKNELAERVGASSTSSTYGNNLGALRSAGMIDYPAQGSAKAAEWLFLE